MNPPLDLFGKDNIDFLENDLCLDVVNLQQKINLDVPQNKEVFNELFNFMFKHKEGISPSTELVYRSGMSQFIWEYRDQLSEKYSISEDSVLYMIIEELVHYFHSYYTNGLLDALFRKCSDNWYPRTKLNKLIEPNDIKDLSNEVVIYRGTSLDEYDSKVYSQSWSLDSSVAMKFARKTGQAEYIGTKRVVLSAKIKKENIFYYSKKDNDLKEKEVIVDSHKLYGIEVEWKGTTERW